MNLNTIRYKLAASRSCSGIAAQRAMATLQESDISGKTSGKAIDIAYPLSMIAASAEMLKLVPSIADEITATA